MGNWNPPPVKDEAPIPDDRPLDRNLLTMLMEMCLCLNPARQPGMTWSSVGTFKDYAGRKDYNLRTKHAKLEEKGIVYKRYKAALQIWTCIEEYLLLHPEYSWILMVRKSLRISDFTTATVNIHDALKAAGEDNCVHTLGASMQDLVIHLMSMCTNKSEVEKKG